MKGMVAIGFGLLLAVVGFDPIVGMSRFTFGLADLAAGFGVVPVALGLLVVSGVLWQFGQMEVRVREKASKRVRNGYSDQLEENADPKNHRVSLAEFKRCLLPVFGGVGIGSAMGTIPGIGTTVVAYLGYTRAKKVQTS